MILAHGLGSNRDETGGMFAGLAAALHEVGIASLRFDFRGNGASDRSHRQATLAGYEEDLATVTDSALEVFDSVSLLGASHGGLVTASFIARRNDDPRIRSIVLWNPVLVPRAVLIDGLSDRWRRDRRDAFWVLGELAVSDALFDEWSSNAVEETVAGALEHCAKPILIVHGVEDEVVPIEHSRAFATLNRGITLVELPATRHGLAEGRTAAIDATVSFVTTAARRTPAY